MVSDEKRGVLGSPYWSQSKRPIYAIWVVLPMLAIYEVGVAALGTFTDVPRGYRNGVDVFIQALLGKLGIYGSFISVAVVVIVLGIWQIASKQSWRANPKYLAGTVLEGVLYATALITLVFRAQGMLAAGAEEVISDQRVAVVFSFGAGVYEEFVFRLLLVPLAIFVLRDGLGASKGGACVAAAILSGVLFALSHHVGPSAYQFNALGFAFRTFAGALFAFFFLTRGFAVTSLTHALYDVGVTLLRFGVGV